MRHTHSQFRDILWTCLSILTGNAVIEMLSLTYPLFTLQGRYGGVYLMEEYRLRRKYLMPQQQELLERLASTLIGEDLEIMLSILRDFALKGADKALQHLEK